MILLAGTAWAAACCSTSGVSATSLASCDALAVALSGGGGLESGGWAWDGAWWPAGDDGDADATVSVAVLGRVAPWLQAGARFPVAVTIARTDGEARYGWGLGDGLLWAEFETPPEWPAAAWPRLAVQVGVGTEGPSGASPGAKVAQGALRGSTERGRWAGRLDLSARVPVIGVGVPDAAMYLSVERSIAARLRLGIVVTGGYTSPSTVQHAVGPTLTWTPTPEDQVTVSLTAGLPVSGLGRDAPSRVVLTVDWLRVLEHTSGG